ncbi:CoA transferase (plasmid) [Arthrobacter sp. Z1-9]
MASPLCGLTLQQLGADVIRVEPLGGAPDRSRWPVTQDGLSLYWNGLNPGKQAIEIDFSSVEGRSLVADLAADAGILLTNTERWPELTHAALSQRRPDMISVLLTGTTDGGSAVDYTVQAATGFSLITGPAEHASPINNPLPAWDLTAGLYLAIGLMAAERRRSHSGMGSEVRVALEDVGLSAAGHLGYLADAMLNPGSGRRADGNYIYGGFGRDFTSKDGARFMLVTLTSRQWSDLRKVMGLGAVFDGLGEALKADFWDEGDRFRHREVLAGLVSEWFGRHTASEVQSTLASTRILWSAYKSFDEMVADDGAMLRSHPMFATVEQPGIGAVLAPGSPVSIDRERGAPAPAPRVGEHTREVLREYLDLDSAKIDDLFERGVVSTTAVPAALRTT